MRHQQAPDRRGSEPRGVDEQDEGRVCRRRKSRESRAQRRAHAADPVRVVDDLRAGDVERDGSDDDDDRVAAAVARQPDCSVDQPLTGEASHGLRAAEAPALAGREDDPGDGHAGCSR